MTVWRWFFIDGPASLVDHAVVAYLTLVAALSAVAILTALGWLILGLLGFPLP